MVEWSPPSAPQVKNAVATGVRRMSSSGGGKSASPGHSLSYGNGDEPSTPGSIASSEAGEMMTAEGLRFTQLEFSPSGTPTTLTYTP